MIKAVIENTPFCIAHFDADRIKYIAKVYDGIPVFLIAANDPETKFVVGLMLLKMPMNIYLKDNMTIVADSLEDAEM